MVINFDDRLPHSTNQFAAEIVARAKQAFDEGVCELWLTSEDTGAYGRDIGTSLPELLWAVIETIPDGCMLRLGMTNPPYIVEHLPEMAKILNHPRVYRCNYPTCRQTWRLIHFFQLFACAHSVG